MSSNHRILIDTAIHAEVKAVFEAVSTAEGLQTWWSDTATVTDDRSALTLTFGPEYTFSGEVVDDLPHARFSVRWTDAMPTWDGTTLSFEVKPVDGHVVLRLEHAGWEGATHEMAKSAYHWPFLLRGLKAWLENGTRVPFAQRGA